MATDGQYELGVQGALRECEAGRLSINALAEHITRKLEDTRAVGAGDQMPGYVTEAVQEHGNGFCV